MKNQKQKVFLLLTTGIFLFLSTISILLISVFNSQSARIYSIDDLVIANIKTQSADIFWKGFSNESGFKVLYKEEKSTAPYKVSIPKNIFPDAPDNNVYVYNVKLEDLKPNREYFVELWHGETMLSENTLKTLSIQDEIQAPEPFSGNTFVFDWMKISNDNSTFITRADENGSWVLDKNLVGSDYKVEIYSSSLVKEDNPISSYLTTKVYAEELANCDEITYSGVASNVRDKAARFQEILKLNGGTGGNPQYLRCYQDVYCESDKVGVNARWSLANWSHESNASDYEYPGSTSYADFGVKCCGVPLKNFQHQFGFFLNLTHNPCDCGSGCSKEEYYCCWANNYLLGTKSLQCTDQSRSYLNSLMSYYYWVSTAADPGTFEGRVNGLPSRIKTTGKSISCGPTDPIDVYNGIQDPPDEPPDNPPEDENPLCCALKLSNREDFVGDFENNVTGGCSDIWEVGRIVHGGRIEYSLELPNQTTRTSCEKTWSGVCCKDDGGFDWVPEVTCSNKATEYTSYNACNTATEGVDRCCALKVTGEDDFYGNFSSNVTQNCNGLWPNGKEAHGGEVEYTFELYDISDKVSCEKRWEGVCCKDDGEYNWILEKDCSNRSDVFNSYEQCLIAQQPLDDFSFSIKQGHNFLSVVGEDLEDPMRASEVLNENPIIMVAGFNDGVWDKLLYKDAGEIKGNDFILEAGKAYLITSLTDFKFKYKGREFTDFEWNNMKGWQLVPAGALKPHRTTKSVVLSFDTVDVSQVALWNYRFGGFDYYVYSSLSGKEYGESVTLNESEGVFVRIE